MENITEQKYKIEELRGTKINKLTILEEGLKERQGDKNRRTFICRCDCGNTKQIKMIPLMRGEVKSCGKCHENLLGTRNGHLEVKEMLGTNKNKQRVLKVKCNNCGSESEMIRSEFNRKEHCGCLTPPPKKPEPKPIKINTIRGIFEIKKELDRKSEADHRMVLAKCTKCGSEHDLVYENISMKDKGQKCSKCPSKETLPEVIRLRVKHSNMINRCLRPSCKDYPNYGGRGISVCDEWRKVSAFVEWGLNNGYEIGLEIDRIDN